MGTKLEVAKKYIAAGHNLSFVLNLCSIARSSWYYINKTKALPVSKMARGRPKPGFSYTTENKQISDEEICKKLIEFRANINFSNAGGSKKIPYYFKRDHGIKINHKKVARLCRKHNLMLPKKKKLNKKVVKISSNRKITAPNQLWQLDIKYGYIHGENRHYYLLAYIDIFTKEILGYHIGKSCSGKDLKITFDRILEAKKPNLSQLVIRSDNGPQMTSHQFRSYVDSVVYHEFIPPGCPNKNAYIESFFSIFEIEFLTVNYFSTFADAYDKTVKFINFYNKERIHGSLKMLPPLEFVQQFQLGEFGIVELSA